MNIIDWGPQVILIFGLEQVRGTIIFCEEISPVQGLIFMVFLIFWKIF